MRRQIRWVGKLILFGTLAAFYSCAHRPSGPQTAGHAGLAPESRAAQPVLPSGLEGALRARLISTDAVLAEARGSLRIRVVAQALFSPDAVELSSVAEEVLQPLAVTLAAYPATIIDVHTYTDSLDPTLAARSQTQQRADNIAAYLLRHGIPTEHVRAHGEGQSAPIDENAGPEGRRANRRIEIVISALSS
jgi:outer membrane protein OmpA-like peptidoglycan-associated protein